MVLVTGTVTGTSTVVGASYIRRTTVGTISGTSTVNGQSTVTAGYDSQLVTLSVDLRTPKDRTVQLAVITMGAEPAEFLYDSQLAILSSTLVQAKQAIDSQLAVLSAAKTEPPMVRDNQLVVLSMVRANPSRRKMRAWTFWMDGHHFYVLHLGDTGTIVFDTTTRKWSEWQTTFYNIWRANYGVNWNEDIVAGSVDSNMLFGVSPQTTTDSGSPIFSSLTAGYPMRLRNSITCDEVQVTASIGMSTLGVVGTHTIRLRTSDDNGKNWTDQGTLDMSSATPKAEVSWRSLGEVTAPGRIFELTETGAAKTIHSMEMFSRDLED